MPAAEAVEAGAVTLHADPQHAAAAAVAAGLPLRLQGFQKTGFLQRLLLRRRLRHEKRQLRVLQLRDLLQSPSGQG